MIGLIQPTAIKARDSYDPHHEAGQLTATTNCRNVKIVLASGRDPQMNRCERYILSQAVTNRERFNVSF